MFEIKKTFEIAGSHCLNLPYESKCNNLHGHNWLITVRCRASDEDVDKNNGMVVDFTHIKKKIHDVLDHTCMSRISCPHCRKIVEEGIEGIGWEKLYDDESGAVFKERKHLRPTAENIARWIAMRIEHCYRVDVQESTGNTASYIEEN
jgi:6-pyruvoyltetrahydropterin/6-carboxytetrahydropterin synthase